MFWGLVFLLQNPGQSNVELGPLDPWENLCNCNYPFLWVMYLDVWVLTVLFLCSSYLSRLVVVPPLYL